MIKTYYFFHIVNFFSVNLFQALTLILNENKLNLKSEITIHNSQIDLKHPKRWNFETLEHWNPGTLEPWNLGTLEPWNPGTLEPWNLISGKSEIFENFLFPIFCTRSRYENSNTLIGNGKWEIGNFVIGNRKSLELWNPGTLEP